MLIAFSNYTDGIVFALEKVISYGSKHLHIIVALCVWWIAFIIGLQQGLVKHNDNLKARVAVGEPNVSTRAEDD
jgi:hypothetical protein